VISFSIQQDNIAGVFTAVLPQLLLIHRIL